MIWILKIQNFIGTFFDFLHSRKKIHDHIGFSRGNLKPRDSRIATY